MQQGVTWVWWAVRACGSSPVQPGWLRGRMRVGRQAHAPVRQAEQRQRRGARLPPALGGEGQAYVNFKGRSGTCQVKSNIIGITPSQRP